MEPLLRRSFAIYSIEKAPFPGAFLFALLRIFHGHRDLAAPSSCGMVVAPGLLEIWARATSAVSQCLAHGFAQLVVVIVHIISWTWNGPGRLSIVRDRSKEREAMEVHRRLSSFALLVGSAVAHCITSFVHAHPIVEVHGHLPRFAVAAMEHDGNVARA